MEVNQDDMRWLVFAEGYCRAEVVLETVELLETFLSVS